MTHLTSDKSALRTQFAAIRSQIPPCRRKAMEADILEHLFSLSEWAAAPLICSYASVRGEIDLSPVRKEAISHGKTLALPHTVTDAGEGRMIFRRLPPDPTYPLSRGRFGIPEPDESCPALSPSDFEGALILVPALAFDRAGFRIGYGGGYYDRFLAELKGAGIAFTAVGLAFSACCTVTLPHEPHDMPVDIIIHERRVIPTHGID